jgi:hypothetical protein
MTLTAARPLVAALVIGGLVGVALASAAARPTLALSASPRIAMAPARVSFVLELKGGADDDRDFYCPTIEWDWDDGTISERSSDCDPYEPGKSTIRRRYFMEREYKLGGLYRVEVRFKRGTRVLAIASTEVEITSGTR